MPGACQCAVVADCNAQRRSIRELWSRSENTLIASIGTVDVWHGWLSSIPVAGIQSAIRANVSQVIGIDPNIQIALDPSPLIRFPDFDSYWVSPANTSIELSPEL